MNTPNKPQYNPKYTTTMNMKSAYEQGESQTLADILKIIDERIEEHKKYFKIDNNGFQHCGLCMEEPHCGCQENIDELEELKAKLQEIK